MKSALLLLLAVHAALAVPVKNVDENYSRFVQIPDDEGVMQLVDLEEQPDVQAIEDFMRNPNNNQYLLFTRLNPTSAQTLRLNDANSISSSNFNILHTTVVIVHGWRSDQNSNMNGEVRDAFLRRSEANVIVMDWSALAGSGYNTAVNGAPAVGSGLGQFLAFLNEVTGAAYDKMHLVGFSLGAHIVGSAGRELDGRIARITGLDPAGPNWQSNINRLGPNDALYVEAIHTNGGNLPNLGIGTPIAKVDFYPNAGSSQPGCGINVICSHERAWQLFASTVFYNRLIGRGCDNMEEVIRNTCNGDSLAMGNSYLSKEGDGPYRVYTESTYPF